jgi:hypothetical protein
LLSLTIGREVSRTYGNGLQTSSVCARVDNLITSISVANKPELSFNYSYDSNKNVTAEQGTSHQSHRGERYQVAFLGLGREQVV